MSGIFIILHTAIFVQYIIKQISRDMYIPIYNWFRSQREVYNIIIGLGIRIFNLRTSYNVLSVLILIV